MNTAPIVAKNKLSLFNMLNMQIFADLISITKQRLVLFVVISVYISYYFASGALTMSLDIMSVLLGVYLAACGAHAINQLKEAKYDALMPRTKNRPLAIGRLSTKLALYYGWGLIILGILAAYSVNWLSALFILASTVIYLFGYTPLKRISNWNTWLGAIAGSMPVFVGWSAVRNDFSWQIFFFPLIIYFWQIPHFLALAWKYKDEYQNAGYKMIVCSDKQGNIVGFLMLLHAIILIIIACLPYFFQIAPLEYLVISLLLGFWILYLIIKFQFTKSITSAKRIFVHCNGYLIGIFLLFIIYAWA